MLSTASDEIVGECLKALGGLDAALYAVAGAVVAWLLVKGGPWAIRAFQEIKSNRRIVTWDWQMVPPALVIVAYIVGPAWLASVIGEPASARDAAILGLGSQGFVLAFVGGTG
jgi:hypothetical protein